MAVVRRLFHDYVRSQWAMFSAAVACMIVTSAASGLIPLIVDYAVKHLFIEKQPEMLVLIPLGRDCRYDNSRRELVRATDAD